MNRMILAGRLGRDPEARYTSSGQKVTTLRLAINQRRSGKDETMWWRVTVWGERFDKMISFLKKGSALIAVGEMTKPQIYTDRDGNPQVSLDLVANDISFSPFGRSSEQAVATTGEATGQPAQQSAFQENSGSSNAKPEQGGQESSSSSSSVEGESLSFSEEDEIPF